MIKLNKLLLVILLFFSSYAFAISDPHLVIIRHGEGDHNIKGVFNSNPGHPKYTPANLTETGKKQAQKVAELLLTYGFDNRNIAAVYVSPLPRTRQTAKIVSDIGVFAEDKMHLEPRLLESQAGDLEGLSLSHHSAEGWIVGKSQSQITGAETNDEVRTRVMALYDEVSRKHKDGHVIFFTHGMPAMELIGSLTREEIRLKTGQAYMLPLNSKNNIS